MTNVRLIVDSPARGSWNMSVDESLLTHANQSGTIALRFYQWQPATVSLGYFQSTDDRRSHTESDDCDMVRRATGGGAIVHDRELTYSLTIPSSDRWSAKNQEIYTQVHKALIRTLSKWDVDASLVAETKKLKKEPFLCFLRRASGDVVLDGNKICGSAQRRIDRSILQHGSILIGKSRHATQLPGINDLSASEMSLEELRSELTGELAAQFRFAFHDDQLSDQEAVLAKKIEEEKFANSSWTNKR